MYQLPDDFRMFVAVADLSDTIMAMADNYDDAVRLASIAGLKHISDDDGSNVLGFTEWEEVRDYWGIVATELPLNSAVYQKMDHYVLYQEVE